MRKLCRYWSVRALSLLSCVGFMCSCAPQVLQAPALEIAVSKPSPEESQEPQIEEAPGGRCFEPPESYKRLHQLGCALSPEGIKVCGFGFVVEDEATAWKCIAVLKQHSCRVPYAPVVIQCEPASKPTEL